MKQRIEWILLTVVMTMAAAISPASAEPQSAQMTVLITGANRGIGLEFARQYKDLGYRVIGTARSPEKAKELKALGAQVEKLDVTESASVKALAAKLDGVALDILINNAGMIGYNAPKFVDFDFDQLGPSFEVNSLGPMRVTQALYDNLSRGSAKKIVHITSTMGSITNNRGGYYGYRGSKAALNMFNKTLAVELAPQGFVCAVLHPGWVKTRLGGQGAILSPEESVAGMLKVIGGLNADMTGQFLDYKGREIPW